MKPFKYVVLIHLTGWIAFIMLPLILFPVPPLFDQGRFTRFIIDLVTSNLLLVGVFYLNYLYGVPHLLLGKRIPLYLLMNTGLLGMLGLVRWGILPAPAGPPLPGRQPEGVLMNGATVFRFIVVILMAVGFRVYEAWRAAQEANVKAELSYLKAQINPHFLFNTLNGLYSLALKKSEQTPDAILKLSSMMRYAMTDADKPEVPVRKELQYIRDYIALQQLRLPPATTLDIQISEVPDHLNIAPILLISFIENAFKYGISTEQEARIMVRIALNSNRLMMQVHNSIFRKTAQEQEEGGIGLTNTRKRLSLLYPGRHELMIQHTDTDFTVILTIQLA